jgi:hypothetical protein
MNSTETLHTDPARAERLAEIERFWLEGAEALSATAPGTPERSAAQKAYVVDILARLEWEHEQGAVYDHQESAQRLNTLFYEGMYRITRAKDAEHTIHMRHDYETWSRYMRSDIFLAIRYRGPAPQSFYDLAKSLRSRHAFFA